MGLSLVVVTFLLAGTVFGTFYWGSKTFRNAFLRHLGENPLQVWTPERQFPGVRSLNVLVLGVDRDLDNKRRPMKTNGRSDSILMAHVDFVSRTIHALTIPRDTAVNIPGRRGIHKINAAHSFGGPPLTIETIQAVFGIPTDAYVTINFDGFCKVVDAIGGVDINVEKRLKYDDNWGGLHVNLYPGYQHLNGYQAMGYVRMRHSDSDEMRSKRQHAFLEAVRVKLKHPSTFLRLPGAVDQLADSLKRSPNLSEDQMFALANFARSLPKENVHLETLPSVEGRSYVSVKREEAEEVIRRIFFPDSTARITIDVPDPDTVARLNGQYRSARARRAPNKPKPSAADQGAQPATDALETPPTSDEPMTDGVGPAPETSGSGETGGDGDTGGAPGA